MPDDGMDWDQWVERYGPAALLFARQIVFSRADAEDALQEGYVRFWRHRGRARDPVALLFACVRTAALDGRRGAARRRMREEQAAATRAMVACAGEDGERSAAVERALAELPAAQREVVVLKIWAGLTLAQIGEALGESANTVASRYRYALEKLSGILTPEVRHER